MLMKQLSVFLENRAGRTKEVTQLLADNNIDIKALSTADRAEFGLLRLIVSDVNKASEMLAQAGFASIMTDVICVNVPSKTSSLAHLMGILANENISAEYMYAFIDGDKTNAIIKPSDLERCISVLQQNDL